MLHETKDSIANLTTIAGAGVAWLDINTILSLLLILTGIVLNITRIWEVRRKAK